MTTTKLLLPLSVIPLALGLLNACSKSSSSSGGASCSITATGGTTGTSPCGAGAEDSTIDGSSGNEFLVSSNAANDFPNVISDIQWAGSAVTAGTYTGANTTQANVSITDAAGGVWSTGGSNGTFTLTISSATEPSPGFYKIHGSLDATLQPGTGATGTATIAMTF